MTIKAVDITVRCQFCKTDNDFIILSDIRIHARALRLPIPEIEVVRRPGSYLVVRIIFNVDLSDGIMKKLCDLRNISWFEMSN
jgi:hypothetical protein